MSALRITNDGWLVAGWRRFPCALGRAGIVANKREGDGATPAGRWPLREILYRPDRITRPVSRLPVSAIAPDAGWCDDPSHPDYNRRVKLPHAARCETLWRDDGLYDLLCVIGYNDAPVIAGRGSAIFMHVAAPRLAPTAGCVALAPIDLRAVLAETGPDDRIAIGTSAQTAA